MSTFSYPPLPPGVDAIRIIRIEPGDFSDPLICTLAPTAFSAKPKYVALSYTWGHSYPDNAKLPTSPNESAKLTRPSPSPLPSSRGILEHGKTWPHPFITHHGQGQPGQHLLSQGQSGSLPEPEPKPGSKTTANIITLNGTPFPVGHSLYLALLHLRSLSEPLTLWVDAICINQADHEERNAQVALMSFIYTRAAAVVTWLGAGEHRNQFDPFRSLSAEWKAGQVQHFAAAVAGRSKYRFSLEPDQRAFSRIAESSYWTRLWVVQELCLPRLLFIVYGSSIWPYEDFLRWGVLQAVRERHRSPGLAAHRVAHDGLEAMLRLIHARDVKFSDAMMLENLLEVFAQSRCSDLKDRVYGLLGLANDVRPVPRLENGAKSLGENLDAQNLALDTPSKDRGGIGSLLVDYNLGFFDIWANTVNFVYFHAKNIDGRFASQAAANSDCPPVLGADGLSGEERRVSVVRTASVIQEALGQKVEEEVSKLQLSPKINDRTVIRALGYLSGEIVHLGPDYESLVASIRAQQDWINGWAAHYHKPADLVTLRRMNEEYMTKIVGLEEKDIHRVREIRGSSTIASQAIARDGPNTDESTDTISAYTKIWDEVDDTQQPHSTSPRVCLGTDYLMGLLPSAAKVGDFIVRFWNCDAAVVMRPFDPGSLTTGTNKGLPSSFLLVGRADVAEVYDRNATPGRDTHAEQALSEFKSGTLNSKAVYIDLDMRTLQMITASVGA